DEDSSAKEKCLKMFRNECGACVRATEASLQGVVELIAIPHFDDHLALVLQYCGPVMLSKVVRQDSEALAALDLKEVSTADKTDIMGQVLNAVLGLNSIGVGHNDVNPPNIMVERKWTANNASSYLRVTLIDLGTATVLEDDGTSELPLTGSREYTDPQVTFERLAKENDIESPGKGRINPFHNDMFAVGIIGTKLFPDLGYFEMDGGLGQAAGNTPTAQDLVRLLEDSVDLKWKNRPTAASVRSSQFFERWQRESSFLQGVGVPARGAQAKASPP
ncbi:unnamed protein product, partial [Ectocarpus fasciculatus]